MLSVAARRAARLPIASTLPPSFALSRYKSTSTTPSESTKSESTRKSSPKGKSDVKAPPKAATPAPSEPIKSATSPNPPSKTVPKRSAISVNSSIAAGSATLASGAPGAPLTTSIDSPSTASSASSNVSTPKSSSPSRPSTSSTSVPVKPIVALKPIRKVQTDPEERDYHAAVVNGRGILTPYQHPAPYGVPVASIHFRSHWPHLLLQSTHFAQHAAASLGIPVSGVAMLPTKRTLWTVLRGPFAHKKSQENFERRIHKRAIKAFDADPEVVDRWVKYLERHSMAGVGMRIVRWHRVPVGVGKEQLESVVGQMRLQLDNTTGKDKLQDLVAQIIAQETKVAQRSQESKVVPSP